MLPSIRPDRVLGAIRARVPESQVHRVIALRTRRAQADAATREKSLQHMRFLLEKTRPDLDPADFVDPYIEAIVRRSEERWHPWMISRMPVTGAEHLLDRRGGAIVNFAHHAQYDGALRSLFHVGGVGFHVVLNSKHWGPTTPAALMQQAKLGTQWGGVGGEPIDVALGARAMMTKLAEGGVISIASDVAGTADLTFAGRRVRGSAGAARIAFKMRVPVCVLTSHRGEAGQTVKVHDPLHPDDFDSPEALLAEMVRRHEEAVLAWPEASDQPAGRWHILDDADSFPPPIE